MTWFFITMIAPLLYAICNHIDKALLDKYFKHGGVGTLMITSALLSAIALPFLFFADQTMFQMQTSHMVALAVVGVINLLVLWFYFLALKEDEASVVVVFYQLVPVFGYLLGYFVLKETLSTLQLVSMAIVILGTSIVSIEVDQDNRFTLRKTTVMYMTMASFFWALESVIFKAVALEESVIRTLFWEHAMLVVFGVLMFVFIRSYRSHFLHAIRKNSEKILALNVANEVLFILASIIFGFAYMLAPISLILLTNTYQPLFVFIIGIGITMFFPRISIEKIHAKHLVQKAIAIAITGAGTYLLLSNS